MRARLSSVRRRLACLAGDRRAGTAIEYGLIMALIFLAMLSSVQLLANTTVSMWNSSATKISNATGN